MHLCAYIYIHIHTCRYTYKCTSMYEYLSSQRCRFHRYLLIHLNLNCFNMILLIFWCLSYKPPGVEASLCMCMSVSFFIFQTFPNMFIPGFWAAWGHDERDSIDHWSSWCDFGSSGVWRLASYQWTPMTVFL